MCIHGLTAAIVPHWHVLSWWDDALWHGHRAGGTGCQAVWLRTTGPRTRVAPPPTPYEAANFFFWILPSSVFPTHVATLRSVGLGGLCGSMACHCQA
jgi:hypothetical protein